MSTKSRPRSITSSISKKSKKSESTKSKSPRNTTAAPRKPRQPKVFGPTEKDLTITPEGNFSFCVPKRCPKTVLVFLYHYLPNDTDHVLYKQILDLVQRDWENFAKLSKPRENRKPREQAEPIQEPIVLEPTDSPHVHRSIDLINDFPVITFEEWKTNRFSIPSERIIQNLLSIDVLLKHLKLHSKSLPYRAFRELQKAMTEIIENIPQSHQVVQHIIENLQELEMEIEQEANQDYDDIENNQPQNCESEKDDE